MVYTPEVNAQITDAVTQTNVKVLGEAPAEALGVSFQSMSNAVSLALENATSIQHGTQLIENTATGALVSLIVKQAGE